MVDFYQQRVAPQSASGTLRGAGADAFGAAIGDAFEEAGEKIKDLKARKRQEDERDLRVDEQLRKEEERAARNQRLAERGAARATGRNALDRELEDLAGQGLPDHDAQAATLIDKYVDETRAGDGDALVTQHFLTSDAELAGTLKTREMKRGIGQRNKTMVGNIETIGVTTANGFETGTIDPAELGRKVAEYDALIDNMDAPPDVKDAAKRERRAEYSTAIGRRKMRDDPRGLLGMIDAGQFNDILTKDGELTTFRNQAEAAAEAKDREAEQARNAGISDFTAASRLTIERVNGGIMVDPAELTTIATRAEALGTPEGKALAFDARKAGGKALVTQRYGSATPAARSVAIRQIEAKAPADRTEADLAALDALNTLNDRDEKRAKDDQTGLWRSTHGRATPNFDLADEGAMEANFRDGDQAARVYGKPPQYMPPEVAEQLRPLFKNGSAAERGATIQQLSRYGARRGAAMMRQVAPEQPEYAAMLMLTTMRDTTAGAVAVNDALAGFDQIKANPKLLDGKRIEQVVGSYDEPLRLMDPDVRTGVLRVAAGLYASETVKSGDSAFNPERYRGSLLRAMGKAGNTGGMGRSMRNEDFVIARGFTAQDMGQIFARSAAPDFGKAAGNDTPLWSGKAVPAEALKRMTPVLLRDTNEGAFYALRTTGGFVKSRRHPGQNFVIDFRALQRLTRSR